MSKCLSLMIPALMLLLQSAQGVPITPGATISKLLTVGQTDNYTFNAKVGQKATIQMSNGPGSGLTPVIQLFGPDGKKLIQASDFPALIQSFPLPADGTYTIL